MKFLIAFLTFATLALANSAETPLPVTPEAPPTLTQLMSAQPVCFSPDGECDQKLAAFYGAAVKEIDIAIYDINRPQLVNTLIKKSKSVKIRIICDERQSKTPHSQILALVKAGIPVKFGHQKGIMHDKFSLIDGTVLQTGSFNYTTHASQFNQENQFYSSDPKVVVLYVDRFNSMWLTAKPFKSH